jgi:hypothetical protein
MLATTGETTGAVEAETCSGRKPSVLSTIASAVASASGLRLLRRRTARLCRAGRRGTRTIAFAEDGAPCSWRIVGRGSSTERRLL